MSRILVVADDPRPLPDTASWWRLPLHRDMVNEDGNVLVQHLGVGHEGDVSTAWAGSIEYFDGQGDWCFPFTHRISTKDRRICLDVLMVESPGVGWRHISTDSLHPDDERYTLSFRVGDRG